MFKLEFSFLFLAILAAFGLHAHQSGKKPSQHQKTLLVGNDITKWKPTTLYCFCSNYIFRLTLTVSEYDFLLNQQHAPLKQWWTSGTAHEEST
jgi:hypothetical protein